MSQSNIMRDWKYVIPLEKSDRQDGWFITGTAAGLGVDLQNDELSERAIERFAAQIKTKPVPFRNHHNANSITADIGQVVDAWVKPDFSLGVEVELDQDNPEAQYLWKKLEKGRQYGMSIKGGGIEHKDVIDPVTKKFKRVFDNVLLEEVSTTTRPVWTPSFGTVLRKAIDDDVVAQGDTTDMGEENPAEVTTQAIEATADESLTPEDETPVEVEKAVTTDTAKDARKLAKLVTNYREFAAKQEALLSELGLLDDTDVTSTDSGSSAETPVLAKSIDTAEVQTLVKAAIDETTAKFTAEIEALKSQIPSTKVPAVLQKSAEEVEISEKLTAMSPSEKLRFGLRLMHNE